MFKPINIGGKKKKRQLTGKSRFLQICTRIWFSEFSLFQECKQNSSVVKRRKEIRGGKKTEKKVWRKDRKKNNQKTEGKQDREKIEKDKKKLRKKQ